MNDVGVGPRSGPESRRASPTAALVTGLLLTTCGGGLLYANGTAGFASLGGGLLGYGLAAAVIARHRGRARLGTANVVTLIRVVLVCLIGVLALETLAADVSSAARGLLVALALTCLALDGVDGRVARARGEVSAFGARFDIETDAALLAACCVAAVALGAVGGWALLLGGLRYAYVLAAHLMPALREPLPPRSSRRVIGVLPVIALVVAILAQPLGLRTAAGAVVALVLALVTWSFAYDVAVQRRAHRGHDR